jgi:hypothetical protein
VLSESVPEQKSFLKNPLVYSSAVVVVVFLAVAFIMYSRWAEKRSIERQADQQRAEKQRQQDRIAVEQLGGKKFAILDFYANPTAVHKGKSAKLCYGVSNAKTVKIEPAVEAVWPSASHCADVTPVETTTYTLTAEDAEGKTLSQTVDIEVH